MDNNLFLIAKFKNDQKQIINYLNESLSTNENRHYFITNENDKQVMESLRSYKDFDIAFIIFEEKESKFKAIELYLGCGNICERNKLVYNITYYTKSSIIIDNYINNSGLDLNDDFAENSYLSMETSKILIKQLEFALKENYITNRIKYEEQNYEPNLNEHTLSVLSQKNQYCKRAIGLSEPDKNRSEFQRDREHIVYAKASRRLVDKAQIFTSSKGDHFRTRMTHTLEVSQISRALALRLNLNHELTEAIALAHDIGHTPFGHQGERTLNSIMRNEIKIIPDGDKIDFGGFKHNLQGLRVLTYLEERYFEHEGLDLSYQVLEGVLKHTKGKIKNCDMCEEAFCYRNCYDLEEFLIHGDQKYLFLKYKDPTTLEGQIVCLADEIAQRGHDLDDAFAAKYLDFNELLSYSQIKKMKPIKEILEKLKEELNEEKYNNKVFIDKNDILRSRLISEIIDYFTQDIVNQSLINMENYNSDENKLKDDNRIDEKLIELSSEGSFILNYLEKIISKKVINSFEVGKFDDTASKIISSLFKAYYNNPKLLPEGTLARIYRDIRKISNNVIDFRNGDPKLIHKELSLICFSEPKDEDNNLDLNDEYIKKRKVLVRNIADHISGMTDNYALNEYNSIYSN